MFELGLYIFIDLLVKLIKHILHLVFTFTMIFITKLNQINYYHIKFMIHCFNSPNLSWQSRTKKSTIIDRGRWVDCVSKRKTFRILQKDENTVLRKTEHNVE